MNDGTLRTWLAVAVFLCAADHIVCQETGEGPGVAVIAVPALLEHAATDAVAADAARRQRRAGLATMAALASRFVVPPLRAEEEIVALGDRTLVALVRPTQEKWLQEFVARNRGAGGRGLLEVRASFFSLEDAAWRRLVAPLLGEAGAKQRHAVLAPGPKTDAYAESIARAEGGTLLATPRLTVHTVQAAQLALTNEVRYVEDFAPQFDDAGRITGLLPVVGVIRDGITMACSCARLDGGGGGGGKGGAGLVGIDLHATLTGLQRPIRSVPLKITGYAEAVEIDVPEVDIAELHAVARVPLGGAALFELPASQGENRKHTVVLIQVTSTGTDEER